LWPSNDGKKINKETITEQENKALEVSQRGGSRERSKKNQLIKL
jgi:hypothetical protein